MVLNNNRKRLLSNNKSLKKIKSLLKNMILFEKKFITKQDQNILVVASHLMWLNP